MDPILSMAYRFTMAAVLLLGFARPRKLKLRFLPGHAHVVRGTRSRSHSGTIGKVFPASGNRPIQCTIFGNLNHKPWRVALGSVSTNMGLWADYH
jgi:hypothetical protein